MKDLQVLEDRLISLKEELKEVYRLYPYKKIDGYYRCDVRGTNESNRIRRCIHNTYTNINQIKMKMMNERQVIQK